MQACHRLRDAGFDLVCVSALDARFEAARLHNLRSLDFPIERVIATGNRETERSPKADVVSSRRFASSMKRCNSCGCTEWIASYLPCSGATRSGAI